MPGPQNAVYGLYFVSIQKPTTAAPTAQISINKYLRPESSAKRRSKANTRAIIEAWVSTGTGISWAAIWQGAARKVCNAAAARIEFRHARLVI